MTGGGAHTQHNGWPPHIALAADPACSPNLLPYVLPPHALRRWCHVALPPTAARAVAAEELQGKGEVDRLWVQSFGAVHRMMVLYTAGTLSLWDFRCAPRGAEGGEEGTAGKGWERGRPKRRAWGGVGWGHEHRGEGWACTAGSRCACREGGRRGQGRMQAWEPGGTMRTAHHTGAGVGLIGLRVPGGGQSDDVALGALLTIPAAPY